VDGDRDGQRIRGVGSALAIPRSSKRATINCTCSFSRGHAHDTDLIRNGAYSATGSSEARRRQQGNATHLSEREPTWRSLNKNFFHGHDVGLPILSSAVNFR
jgi:hypothetical protein